jgi:hypothetical protein
MRVGLRWFFTLVIALCLVLAVTACGSHPKVKPKPRQAAGGSVHPANWGAPAPKSELDKTTAPVVTLSMFDDITLSLIPSDAVATAGYNPPSSWPTYVRLHTVFPHAHNVSVAVSSNSRGECGDFEPGDMTPAVVGKWVRFDEAGGYKKPCVYSSYYEYVNEIRPALAADGIARSTIFEWDADYTYQPHLDASFDATQFTDKALGRSLDESEVSQAFLEGAAVPALVVPKPKPKPKPVPKPKPKPKPVPKPTPQPKLICFGTKAQVHNSKCMGPRQQVATDFTHFRAELATYHSRGCPALAKERLYFATALHKQPTVKRARRTAALRSIIERQGKARCTTLGAGARSLGATIQRIEKEYS